MLTGMSPWVSAAASRTRLAWAMPVLVTALQLWVYAWLKSSYKLPASDVTGVCSHIL